ncbi:MAG: hypothetical protein ACREDE_08965 [Thermoplasmata archaeon]
MLTVAIVAVALVLVLAFGVETGGFLNSGRVHVLQVLWYQNGTALGTQGGFTVNAGRTVDLSVGLYCA